MFTRMEWTLVSLSALWDRYKAVNAQLIAEIQNKSVYPGLLRSFEKFFEENGYVWERPMTDAEFRQYSNDPIEVEQYKTKYTTHYLEYQKMVSQYSNIDKTISEFVQANNEIWVYFWRAVFNTIILWGISWALVVGVLAYFL